MLRRFFNISTRIETWILYAAFFAIGERGCGSSTNDSMDGQNARSKIDYGGSNFYADQKGSEDSGAPAKIYRHMGVRGITGSFNRGDVHDIMATRTNALLDCVDKRPRHLRFVNGVIAFHFVVGSKGQVLDVYPSRSDVGYFELEQCLADVVAQTRFMPPCGSQQTELDWDMRVEKDWESDPEPMHRRNIRKALERYSADAYEACEVKRRIRFIVTAYIDQGGRVLSSGLIPNRRVEIDQIECMVNEINRWRVPRPKKLSKVTFKLRWIPPPPEKKKRKKRRRRR
jgi:hypothetical protein